MEHIAAALKKFIKKQGIEKEINQQKATDVWEEAVGKKINEPFFNIRSKMSKLSIPVEIMSTSSACRTWNVLLSEGRNLLACIKNEY